jgi:probable HAF family extracellular repeat protein
MNWRAFLLAAWLALGLPLSVHATPLYNLTVIGTAGSVPYGINSAGHIVGQQVAGEDRHAFYFDGTTLSDLGTLGGASSIARAINDSGTVVGMAYTASGALRGFTWSGGALTALPEGVFDARGINNGGAIVGIGRYPDGLGYTSPRAITYANGVVTNLGLLPGNDGEGSYGLGINDAGLAVGEVEVGGAPNRPSQPFLYSGGVMQDLGSFGGIYGAARAINDHGQVVGAAGGAYQNDGNLYPAKAFLWDDGVLRALGEFVPNGDSVVTDINNAGLIVGQAVTADGVRGFLYRGDSMVTLDSLIDSASGWTITAANGINDLQQIAATACHLGACYAVRLDLAAAIPEPGQVVMLGAGLLVLLAGGAGRTARRRSTGSTAWQANAGAR